MTFSRQGYEILEPFIGQQTLAPIVQQLNALHLKPTQGGLRNLHHHLRTVRDLVYSPKLLQKAQDYLGDSPSVVRVLFFDKTPSNNWLVPWHQDRAIAVSHKQEIPGWGPWSIKDTIPHVHPPANVLNQIVTFRIHLDAAEPKNGCLRVIPGSHLQGILSTDQIKEIVQTQPSVNCTVQSESVMVMKPLLLHASSKATHPIHRRVIQVEYSSYRLPEGMDWDINSNSTKDG
ncbi:MULTISPECIES: phytanoyl-CoA dioxygenase family protein [unclassified Roseofilum]|uniref:phytanoyl-CoA dioxygenase family protein n=1 Tax=unclassified Roseofilum TaxID=2620099 RepID=UPI000E7F71C6|nr:MULTISPECIES: phytanoyl-CoA dioxygenase family protein [unclassified Roseofilum]MBP0011005.1 phytanoyl-CoA dioxygenase family protein [Roseofilum sp. Belize Diploria]MBP0035383.1 phytanoyl-CoA dioxygenase family protein [Roseofilum sp. Belize BBD 4]HBR00746.1 hypothetical protein [Cyanobacteria bacterium UBA11691]